MKDGNEKLYDFVARSHETALECLDASKAVQADMQDADINVIVYRYGVTGVMPDNVRVPTFGDFTHIVDYRTALEAIQEAEENFLQMPANVRARFENNPQLFLEFCTDANNLKEMVDLGLAIPNNIQTQQQTGVPGNGNSERSDPSSPA